MTKSTSLLALAGIALAPLCAQTADPTADAPPAAGQTVITSDELHMDQAAHNSVFTGNVLVVGTNFNMRCEEMTVFFTTGNKINDIIAKGNVVINQPGRITHCGLAHYFRDSDKFVLTDQPDILDNQNEISAPEITIYRSRKQLETKGRSTTKIIEKNGGSSTNTAATPALPTP